jgi:hypothetical protein
LNNLERKKLELERMKVACAKSEMEFRILEHEENIERLMQNMENQEKRIIEIDSILNQ